MDVPISITAQDMTSRYDVNMLLRLCFDDEKKHFESELHTSPILQAAIEDAYGTFRAALSVADMYTDEQLSRLTKGSLSLAKRIICSLAIAFLYSRRGGEGGDKVQLIRENAEMYLDRLRKGERIFAIEKSNAKEDAGKPSLVVPSVADLRNLNGITHRARVYFGDVASRQHTAPYRGGG